MEKTFKKSALPLLLAGAACLFILAPGVTGLFSGSGGESPGPGPSDLESVLSEINGVGKVRVYRQGGGQEEQGGILMPLDSYFGTSTGKGRDTPSGGILVVAEGAGDPRIRAELVRILSGVLQLPEHRIVVVEMKNEGEEG
ncbi:hypothetical protein AV656_02375 [Bhargavaea cecembensis]|uniref:Stage III sporulation protein AG n=1 Tax=Bhargavaea cecembensis TaxID=394098 RepID=A0A161SVX7_9BACL|nr:hypothetical protein [Bhargavaea cecembensis]KZE40140.1 hypothetical protein AV656_02375 [Bhargavaea cecembensis]